MQAHEDLSAINEGARLDLVRAEPRERFAVKPGMRSSLVLVEPDEQIAREGGAPGVSAWKTAS